MAVEEKAAECDVLLSRYKALKSQYAGDIRRLTFIVEGEIEYQHVPHSTKCPFCDGNMPIHDRKSYIEASRAELSRIMAQLNGLGEAESDVQKEQIDIENELVELRSKRKDIEVLINEQLRPQADALQDALENYPYTESEQETIKNWMLRMAIDQAFDPGGEHYIYIRDYQHISPEQIIKCEILNVGIEAVE